jgi:FkbM family methyltransferase
MQIISNLFLYIRYHFFEVSIPGGNSISYKFWAFKRLIKYLSAGGKECGYYLKEDLEIKNSIGFFHIPKNTDLVLTVSSKSENNLVKHFDLKDPFGVFLDIGANAGKYSVKLGNRFPNSKIYSFEPNPTTYGILTKNIALNGLGALVKSFNIGLSESESMLSFDSVNYNTGLSRIVKNDQTPAGTIHQVPVKSLDFVVLQNEINPIEIDLVKIDVEGHELEVVIGGKNTLSKMKNGGRLLVEIHPDSSNKSEILDRLQNYGFDLQQLDIEYFLATKI